VNASMNRAVSIARKELMHIMKDPRTLLIVFIMPLVQLVMFGYAFDMEIHLIPVGVVDRDNSTESRRLVEAFRGSDLFRLSDAGAASGDVEASFQSRETRAVLVIPPGFGKDLARGPAADVQMIIDASDPNSAQLMKNYFGQVLAGFNESGGRGGAMPFDVRTSILYNPDLKSAFFFVPGIVAMIMVMICALLTSITVAREKETGTMEQLLVSPVRPREIIAGKVLPYVFLAFLDGTFILVVGILLFGVPFNGSLLLMVGLSTLYIITALSLGLMISTVARTQQVAIMMALTITMLPTIMLSGLVFPIESMPKALQYFTYIVPARYFLQIIRGILLKGSALAHLWQPALSLLIMTSILLTVAVRRFGMKLER